MADQSQGSVNDKALRENLIATAVTFLQNDKVRQSPFRQRRAFLEKKGLTLEEIDEAVKRSGTADDETNTQIAIPMTQSSPAVLQQAPLSAWEKVRNVLTTIFLVTGTTYSIFAFFKKYIAPLIFGSKKSEKDKELLDAIKSINEELKSSMTEIVSQIGMVQRDAALDHQQVLDKMNSLPRVQSNEMFGTLGTTEIKDELKSLKALLLSRNQFAPLPSITPVLPSWQLQQKPKVENAAGDPSKPPESEPSSSKPDGTDDGRAETVNGGDGKVEFESVNGGTSSIENITNGDKDEGISNGEMRTQSTVDDARLDERESNGLNSEETNEDYEENKDITEIQGNKGMLIENPNDGLVGQTVTFSSE